MLSETKQPDWQSRLDEQVQRLHSSKQYRELTFNRFKELVGAPSETAFLRAVAKKIAEGRLSVFYRVISPKTKAALERFESPIDVPDSMLDESTGDVIDVDRFKNVEAVYVAEAVSAH